MNLWPSISQACREDFLLVPLLSVALFGNIGPWTESYSGVVEFNHL